MCENIENAPMRLDNVRVREHKVLAGDYRVLVFDAPEMSAEVLPGQFVHLLVPRFESAVLRRPFSIYGADGETLSILYKEVGRGTAAMRSLSMGDEVSLIGPLGKGFPLDIGDAVPALVAGGFGVAPLSLLARALGRVGSVFIGGRSSQDILLADEFVSLGWSVEIATMDGSLGEQGLVTAPLVRWLDARRDTGESAELFACGPDGMLKAVGDLSIAYDFRGWLSLDKHMGGGVGACLACVQQLRRPDGTTFLGRVCKDGPIFEARDLVWEEGK